jgi:hypothetical protein
MRKQAKKTLFSHRSEKYFASISLWSENYGSFSLLFRFISLWSENYGSFSFPFCFISLLSENDCNFSLLFRFVFASFHFRFASDFYISYRCEKSTFFLHRSEKISLPFRFISLRSENDGAPCVGLCQLYETWESIDISPLSPFPPSGGVRGGGMQHSGGGVRGGG